MARLGEMLGFGDNPFYKAFNSNRNAVIGGFANIGSNPLNPAAGFSQGFAQGSMLDTLRADEAQEAAKLEEQTNATRSWLEQQGFTDLVPLVDAGEADIAYSEALKRMQPADTTANQNDFLFARSNGYEGSFEDWVNGAGNGGSFGLTPIWGKLPDGSFGYGVQGRDGTFHQVDTGDLMPLDPRSLAGERAYGTATGSASGEAAAAAPGDIASGEAALNILDQIESHPELGWATGTSAGLGGNAIPGTGRYDFQNLVDQAKSGAFLIAVQEMRGLGALSNAEGGAATQAITRMNTATSTEAFKKALADYRAIIERGVERARARLGGGQQSSGQNFVYNPATGQLEPQ